MLKKVRIKNFLSCEDTEIEFDPITVLIGRNAAGKTCILKNIQWVIRYAIGKLEYLHEYANDTSKTIIEFTIGEDYFKYDLTIKNIVEINGEKLIKPIEELLVCKDDTWKMIINNKIEKNQIDGKVYKVSSPIIYNSYGSRSIPFDHIDKTYKYLSEINYYSFESFEGFISNDFINSIEVENSINFQLYKNKDNLEELESLLGENGLDLINEIIISNDSSKKYEVNFCIKNRSVSYKNLSFGTQRVLWILLILLYGRDNVLMLEHPEDGIHLGLLRKVLSICFTYAEAYNKQLIITTHSPDVIDMFKPENIRIVRMTEQGTKVSPLDKERIPFIRDYIENEGALSDFIEAMDDE